MLSSSMTQLCLCVCVCMAVLLHSSLGLPAQHHGWLRLWEEDEGCGTCNQRLCPPAPVRCPAGRLKDDCGCCEQCANVEGQRCDPDPAQRLYGRCGEGLVCQRKAIKGGRQEPEPTCVCQEQDPVCGSDGWTHQNVCQMREAGVRRNTAIKLSGRGPCSSGYCTLLLHMLSRPGKLRLPCMFIVILIEILALNHTVLLLFCCSSTCPSRPEKHVQLQWHWQCVRLWSLGLSSSEPELEEAREWQLPAWRRSSHLCTGLMRALLIKKDSWPVCALIKLPNAFSVIYPSICPLSYRFIRKSLVLVPRGNLDSAIDLNVFLDGGSAQNKLRQLHRHTERPESDWDSNQRLFLYLLTVRKY